MERANRAVLKPCAHLTTTTHARHGLQPSLGQMPALVLGKRAHSMGPQLALTL